MLRSIALRWVRIWRRHHYRWRAANFDLDDQHSWPLSSKGFLIARHTYCNMGHPFIMVISEDRWHSHLLRVFSSGAVTICFYNLGLSQLGFEHPTFRLRGQRSNNEKRSSVGGNHTKIGLMQNWMVLINWLINFKGIHVFWSGFIFPWLHSLFLCLWFFRPTR